MSEHDADMYARILNKVKNQVQALRIMLSSIEVGALSGNLINTLATCMTLFLL